MENTIVKYIRQSRNRKKGLLVAGVEGGKMYVGYSLCNDEDKFDSDMALSMAQVRALVLDTGRAVDKVPTTVRSAMKKFRSRCVRYYKGVAVPTWVDTVLAEATKEAADKVVKA